MFWPAGRLVVPVPNELVLPVAEDVNKAFPPPGVYTLALLGPVNV